MSQIITDPDLILKMQRSIQRDDARRVGIREENIERSLFVRWRLERAGLLHQKQPKGKP